MQAESFEWLIQKLATHRQELCFDENDDMVIVVCGDEGSGKSIFSLALGAIDPQFDASQIYYFWRDFLRANNAAFKKMGRELPGAIFQKNNIFQLDAKALVDTGEKVLDRGAMLLYDESGTQMFARSSMSKGNIQQIKLFMANRFLNFVTILVLPKIKSLDKYMREERIKYFFYIYKKRVRHGSEIQISRICYAWSRQSFKRMQATKYWWSKFGSDDSIESLNPDFKITLPDLKRDKYINPQVLEDYDAKKKLFNLKQTIDMEENVEEQMKKEKPKKDYAAMLVQPGELKEEWVRRVNRPPHEYKKYLCE